MRPLALVVLLLAGCGRLHFGAAAGAGVDGGAGGDAIDASPPAGTLAIEVHEAADDPAPGAAIAGASVVAIARDGTTTVVTTGEDGTATLDVGGATTVHVAYDATAFAGTAGWRLFTVTDAGGGETIRLGAPASLAGAVDQMTVTLPPLAGAAGYDLELPTRCRPDAVVNGETVDLSYDAACEGQTVKTYAAAQDGAGANLGVIAGTLTLGEGTAPALGGSWSAATTYTLAIGALPDTQELIGELGWRDPNGPDVVFANSGGSTGPVMPDTLSVDAPSDVNLVVAGRVGTMSEDAYIGPLPAPAGAIYAVDAWLAPISGILATGDQLGWSVGSGDRGSLAMVHATVPSTDPIAWTVYAPAAVQAITFPTLPPPLDALVPSGAIDPAMVEVGLVGGPDASFTALLGYVDDLLVGSGILEEVPRSGLSVSLAGSPTT